MDPRLDISDSPREIDAPRSAPPSPLALAWRALRQLGEQHAEELARADRKIASFKSACTAVALEAYGLRRAGNSGQAERLEKALASAGVKLVAPVGEEFKDPWVEIFDSIATRPQSGLQTASIVEVVSPAIFWEGLVITRGKAIIGIPEEAAAEKNDGESESQSDPALLSEQPPS
jgi:hypothetical protein